jgi:hypothetical protein
MPGEPVHPCLGVCWDADRLTLWRMGRQRVAARLFTHWGRLLSGQDWARELVRGPDRPWAELSMPLRW